MRKFMLIALVMFLCSGWSWKQKKDAAIVIGDIRVTAEEFENALAESRYEENDPAQRREFLDAFIARKLILKEAERKGLDKDPEFLKSLQLFWEQSLLKLVIAKRMDEATGSIKVEQKEINKYYLQHKLEFGEKTLSEVYNQIKWILFKEKQRAAIEDWTEQLKAATPVDIDYNRLGMENNENGGR